MPMRKVTFIHAADVHLGAPFRGLRDISDAWAKRLMHAIPEAYDRLIDTAIARKVDFVILAGDMFDTSHASYCDYNHFFKGLRKLEAANIPVYLCTGNHDPYTSYQYDLDLFPGNVTLFDSAAPSFALYERDGEPLCLLGGRSYYNQTWPHHKSIVEGIDRAAAVRALDDAGSGLGKAAAAPFMVGVVHTGLDFDKNKAPAEPQELVRMDVDYWACGHLHMRIVYPSYDNPRVVMPGSIQGRDIKETGERGCFLVTLEEDKPPVLENVPTASVVFERIAIDVGECRTLADVESLIQRVMFQRNGAAWCEEMVVRIALTGETKLHTFLARESVRDDMRKHLNGSFPVFFCDALVDRTSAARDTAALSEEGLFPATVLAMAADQQAHEDEVVSYVQAEFVKRGIPLPASLTRRLDMLEDEATGLVLDLLAAGEEP